MAKGRHGRSRQKTTKRVLSVIAALVIIGICIGAIIAVEAQHDSSEDAGTQALSPALSAVVGASGTSTTRATSRVSSPTRPSAPLTSTTTAPPGSPRSGLPLDLKGRTIVIDPGHNGGNGAHPDEINRQVQAGGFTKACDTTGTEANDGYPEHAFTFDVSSRLVQILRDGGADVVLTRTDDSGVGPCVNERAAIGNDHHADLALSIHADGGPANGRGFHVLPPAGCNGCVNDIVAPSSVFADDLRDAFRVGTSMPISNYLGTNGIYPRSDLGGLNLSTVPKVFIECGNMRNATDASMLEDPEFRQQAAEAIANGIATYLSTN